MENIKLTIATLIISSLSYGNTCQLSSNTTIFSEETTGHNVYLTSNYGQASNTWIGKTDSPLSLFLKDSVPPHQLLTRHFVLRDQQGKQVGEVTEYIQLYHCAIINSSVIAKPSTIRYEIEPINNYYSAKYFIPSLNKDNPIIEATAEPEKEETIAEEAPDREDTLDDSYPDDLDDPDDPDDLLDFQW